MQKALYILGQLSDLDVEWLIEHGRREEVAAGHVLIRQGVQIESLYIILAGSFSAVDETAGAKELSRMGAGEIVGELSFVDASPPSATVRAVEPGIVLALPRVALHGKMDSDPAFAARFYRALALFLSDRVRSLTRRLAGGTASVGDELDLNVLERIHLAGARFERILQRLTTAA